MEIENENQIENTTENTTTETPEVVVPVINQEPETQEQTQQEPEIIFERTGNEAFDDVAETLVDLKLDPKKIYDQMMSTGKLHEDDIATLKSTKVGRVALQGITALYNEHIQQAQRESELQIKETQERLSTIRSYMSEEEQKSLYDFAKTLNKEDIEGFNKALTSGSKRDIELNIKWLKEQYAHANKDLPRTQQTETKISSSELYYINQQLKMRPNDKELLSKLESYRNQFK